MNKQGFEFWVVVVCLLSGLIPATLSQTAPTITLDKKVILVQESQASTITLATATCTTTPASDACSVSVQTVTPSNPCGSSCFAVYPCNNNPNKFCLQFLPGQGFLNPSVANRYLIVLNARDTTNGKSAQALADIRIAANSPPYFKSVNMSESKVVTLTKLVTAGTILASVAALDDDGDSLTYTMTTVPDVGGRIVIDSVSGVIRTTRALREMCMTDFAALIMVQDSYNSAVGPYVINFDLQGANHAPILTNLDRDLLVREDANASAVLTLNDIDIDVYPSVRYIVTMEPQGTDSLFHIVGNDVTVKSALDYETQPKTIIMNIRASDGFCESEQYRLVIKLVDINEPPILLPVDQTLETCEGVVSVLPKWDTLQDPDADDVVTFTNIQPNPLGRFYINKYTGMVATTIDYNVDGSEMPTTTVLVVTLSDLQLYTATATLTIRFADCNDNPPEFPKPSREFAVGDCEPADTVVGVIIKATDADSTYQQNNVIYYSGSGGGASVEASGSVVTHQQFQAGEWLTFTAYAHDLGQVPGPLTSRAYYVSIYCEPCPITTPKPKVTTTANVTTTTTTEAPNADNPWTTNQGWVLAVCGLGTVLFCLLIYMMVRHLGPACAKSCNTPESPRHRNPLKGQTRRSPARKPHQPQPLALPPPPPQPLPIEQPQPQPYTVELPADQDSPPVLQDAKAIESAPPAPPEAKFFDYWKENYNDKDYGRVPDRNRLPEPSPTKLPPALDYI